MNTSMANNSSSMFHFNKEEKANIMNNNSISMQNMAGTENIVFGIINTLLGLSIVVGNCLIISAVIKRRTLQSCAGFIVLNMAVTDLLVGLVVLVSIAPSSFLNFYPYSDSVMAHIAFVSTTASYMSIYSLTLVTLDRWVAVTKPDFYTSVMTRKKVGVYVAGFWCLAMLNAGLGFIFPRCYTFASDRFSLELCLVHCGPYSIYIYSSVHLLHFLIMLVGCTQIVREIRKKRRVIGTAFETSKLLPYFKQQVKFSKILVIILIMFVVSTYPYMLYSLILKNKSPSKYLSFVGTTMMNSNSLLRVVVYMTLATPIRRAVVALFRKEKTRRNRFELFIVSPSLIRRKSMESAFNK